MTDIHEQTANPIDDELSDPKRLPDPGDDLFPYLDNPKSLALRFATLYDQSEGCNDALLREAWEEYRCQRRFGLTDSILRDEKGEGATMKLALPIFHIQMNAILAQTSAPFEAEDPYFKCSLLDEDDDERSDKCEQYHNHLCRNVMRPRYAKHRRLAKERALVEGFAWEHHKWERKEVRVVVRGTPGKPKAEKKVVYDNVAIEIVPRSRVRLYKKEERDVQKAAIVQIEYPLAVSTLKADRAKAKSERVYTISDEDWAKVKKGDEGIEPDPKDTDDETEDTGLFVTARDVYGSKVIKGEEIPCLFTYLPKFDLMVKARHSVFSMEDGRTVPLVKRVQYTNEASLWEIVQSIVIAMEAKLSQVCNQDTLAQLLAMTGITNDADLVARFVLGRLNWSERPVGDTVFPFQRLANPTLTIEVFRELDGLLQEATGVNPNIAGAFTPKQMTATEARAGLEVGSRIFDQIRSLDADADKENAEIMAYSISLHGGDGDAGLIEFNVSKSEAEQREEQALALEETDRDATDMESILSLPSDPLTGSAPKADILPGKPAVKKTMKKVTLHAKDFGPGLEWSVAGMDGNTIDKATQIQNAVMLYQLFGQDPDIPPDGKWEMRNDIFIAAGKKNPDRITGPKPTQADIQEKQQEQQKQDVMAKVMALAGGMGPNGQRNAPTGSVGPMAGDPGAIGPMGNGGGL